jgi:cobalt transporter subunit CbtB
MAATQAPQHPSAIADVALPPAIPLSQAWPFAVLALALGALVYLVGAEQGATSVFQGVAIHEWVHDGRHLLGFPCH